MFTTKEYIGQHVDSYEKLRKQIEQINKQAENACNLLNFSDSTFNKKNEDLELIREEDDADDEAVFIESGQQRSHEA